MSNYPFFSMFVPKFTFITKIGVFVLAALLLQSCSEGRKVTQAKESETKPVADILIQNVTAIDVKNGSRSGVNVLITGNIISGVYSVGDPNVQTAKTLIDGTGKYMIPGLWDSHVHLTFDDKVSGSMNRLFIANGVTSVRDTGGLLDLVLQARDKAKKEVSPNIYFAGPLLDGVPSVYKGDAPGFPEIAKTVATPEQAVLAVDELAAAGAHLIKAYEMLSPDVFKAVIERAKYHNLPVTGHVPLSMTAIQASAAGMNSMEHMRNLELACAANEAELLEQRLQDLKNPNNKLGSQVRTHIHSTQRSQAVSNFDSVQCKELISQLVKSQTWQVPTMALNMRAKTPYYADSEWQKTYQGLPKLVAQDWIKTGNSVAAGLAEPSQETNKMMLHADWQIAMLQRLVKAGVTIMAGTDTPIAFLTPGFSLHLELERLVEEGGMSPMQALEAATLTPAKYFNLQDTVGTIELGMMADMVLLDANPLQKIQNTTTIRAVFKAGELFNRKALDQLLITD